MGGQWGHSFKWGHTLIITIDPDTGLNAKYCLQQLYFKYWLYALVIKTKSHSISPLEYARQRVVTSTVITQTDRLGLGHTFEW